MVEANPYLLEIWRTLPRLFASYDRDPLSPTLGVGDRLYWAWKTHDFANATPQGAVNGLARLAVAGLLPPGVSDQSVLGRIDEMIMATRSITARDGSLSEAFPNEKSFCVTALIAFDILSAADTLAGRVDATRLGAWREVVAPLIDFIVRNDETHAVISNHLATACAALWRWRGAGAATAQARADALLDIILSNQSAEGWYSEYGAADPGYETLGLYYLADVHRQRRRQAVSDSLSRSIGFLTHFAHPDGSFGGIYGARNTRFIVPGGLEDLAADFPEAAALARFARQSIARQRVVTLSALDDPNLAPNFNAYCVAAACLSASSGADTAGLDLPSEQAAPWRRHFPHAQLIVDNGPGHYTVVSAAKGGVVAHFGKQGGAAHLEPGACVRVNGEHYTTQALRQDNGCEILGDRIVVTAPFVKTIVERPTPFKFLVLRSLALTLFHVRPLTEFIKRLLVRRLITGQKRLALQNRRTITLGPVVEVLDETLGGSAAEVEAVSVDRPFTAIHMASAGYWQAGDDQA